MCNVLGISANKLLGIQFYDIKKKSKNNWPYNPFKFRDGHNTTTSMFWVFLFSIILGAVFRDHNPIFYAVPLIGICAIVIAGIVRE